MASLLNVGRGLVEKIPSVLNYVQSGLVAMWDGIENAGIGVHDNTATTWKDLSGNNRNWVLEDGTSWVSNAFVTSPQFGYAAKCDSIIPAASNITQEIVFEMTDYIYLSDRTWLFRLGPTAKSGQYNMVLRGLMYNKYNNIYGWMPKAQSVLQTDVQEPSKETPFSIVTVFKGTALKNHPSLLKENNVTKGGSWVEVGAADSINFMWISREIRGFYGKVYAIRVYNRALTTTELTQNYELDKIRFRINI